MKAKTAPRTGRLPAEEAAQIPERLLDAATQLFTGNGYAKTSMEAIAKQAGASSKTVYSRFANKEEVLRAVVRRLFDRAVSAGEAVEAKPIGGDPRAFLLEIGRELAELSAEPQTGGVNRLIMAEAFQVPELAQLFIELHERACGIVREPLEQWKQSGVLPQVPEPALAAIIFVEMVASIPRIRALLGQPLEPELVNRLVGTAVEIFLRGCGYRE